MLNSIQRNINYPNSFDSTTENKLQFYVCKAGLKRDALDKLQLSEKHLWTASSVLLQEWKSLARCLALSENDIFMIEQRHFFKDGIRECCHQVLLKWRETKPKQCYLSYLCSILIQINLNFYVCQLFEIFSKHL